MSNAISKVCAAETAVKQAKNIHLLGYVRFIKKIISVDIIHHRSTNSKAKHVLGSKIKTNSDTKSETIMIVEINMLVKRVNSVIRSAVISKRKVTLLKFVAIKNH